MKSFKELVTEHAKFINELMPWDLQEKLSSTNPPLILDIREPEEYNTMRIKPSINVPRGILESACDYDYSETIPMLVKSRNKEIVVVCRSGNRSVLAVYTMQQMGYQYVASLKTGLKGWNDYEQPLFNKINQIVDVDVAESFLSPKVHSEQSKH